MTLVGADYDNGDPSTAPERMEFRCIGSQLVCHSIRPPSSRVFFRCSKIDSPFILF